MSTPEMSRTAAMPVEPSDGAKGDGRVAPIVVRRRKPIAREAILKRAAKAAATKLAKRITKTCQHCGRDWKEKPSHAWRRYCSRACMKAAYTKAAEFPCPDCGTLIFRKRCDQYRRCRDCAKKRQSDHLRGIGHTPYFFETSESRARRLAALTSPEHRKWVSERFKDKPKTAECQKKFSPHHACAVECFFRDPRNVIHYCRNISRFVHEHKSLFDPADTQQKVHGGKPTKSYVCNATQGLARIQRGANGSWKGWMVVTNREGRERHDLIGRNGQADVGRGGGNHSGAANFLAAMKTTANPSSGSS